MYKKSELENKEDARWILLALFSGLFSHFLYLLSLFGQEKSELVQVFSLNAGFYIFLFSLIFTVSQRMVPFFTRGKIPGYLINKSKYLLPSVYFLLLIKVIFLSMQNVFLNLIIDSLLFMYFIEELFRWKLPFRRSEAILWILHISLLWIPVGFLVSIFEGILFFQDIYFEKAVLHLFALGFFLSILLGFATRVILGHSGAVPFANKTTVFCFIALQFLVLLRFFAALLINTQYWYKLTITLSVFLLLCILLLWSFKYLKILLK